MRVTFGLKAHSGWAALVVIGNDRDGLQVIDRRRIELAEDGSSQWPGQPYHAADGLPQAQARKIVQRGIDAARRLAVNELRAAIKRTRDAGHEVAACAVLMPAPMPDWSTEEILAVHLRMHKAEGAMYPEALARGAKTCGLDVVGIAEKSLGERAGKMVAVSAGAAMKKIAVLGKSVGAPWGADQKNATLAAMIALEMVVQAE